MNVEAMQEMHKLVLALGDSDDWQGTAFYIFATISFGS